MIPISCGSIEAATERRPQGDAKAPRPSGSRFVLPFAYRPVPLTAGDGDTGRALRYRPSSDAADPSRRTYPTVETARVLFQRAGWFRLGEPGEEVFPSFRVDRHKRQPGGYFQARIESVRLVLFEWQHERERALRRSEPGPWWRRGKAPAKPEKPAKPEYSDNPETTGQPTTEGDLLATGFLLLDVSFDDSQGPVYLDDLLVFNELFRYIRCPYPEHDAEKKYRTILADLPIDPENPWRRLGDVAEAKADAEGYQGRWARLLEFAVEDGEGKRWHLFPTAPGENWNAQAKEWLAHGELDPPNGWAIYADSRAYVSTAAMVEGGLDALQNAFPGGDKEACGFGHWIRLLNMDLPEGRPEGTHACSPFERQWAEERTYRRWEHLGTVYGFTYHSGALLGPAHPEYKVDAHWRTVYFDQTLLLLYLRVTSFRFSRALSELSGENRRRNGGPEAVTAWQERFQALRHSFAVFTNLYEFPLISNQQQGIELYALAREVMDLKELFREVREEILGTHEFFESVATQQANLSVEHLTQVAMVLGAGALVTGFFGMNVFVEEVEALGPGGTTLRVLGWGLSMVLIGALLGTWGLRWLLRRLRRPKSPLSPGRHGEENATGGRR